MLAVAVQFPVTMKVEENLAELASALNHMEAGSLAVAPEGSLSGYEPERDLVTRLDTQVTGQAIEAARRLVEKAQVHLVVDACVYDSGGWFNPSFYMGPNRELFRYDKINLAQSERGQFRAGNSLPVHDIMIAGKSVRLGI